MLILPAGGDSRQVPTMIYARTAIIWVMACWGGLAATGCRRGTDRRSNMIDVVVAASLADVVDEIGRACQSADGTQIRVTSGASGVLCEQVRSGARCDIFIPADAAYIDRLFEGTTHEAPARFVLASNRLVLVGQRGRASASQPVDDTIDRIDEIQERLNGWKRIAIANPAHAPAGARAKEALSALGAWESLRPRLVFADDVRMAARYVAEGVADGGIVYQTDALAFSDSVAMLGRFDASLHASIRYEGVTGPNAVHEEEALRFLKFMQGAAAREIWRRYGFDGAE